MVIKISQEQLDKLSLVESEQYMIELYEIIIKYSLSFKEDAELLQRLKDADGFVKFHSFKDKKVMTDFLITNAYEPYFYENAATEQWLLQGSESVEAEYIKYQQIKHHLINRFLEDNL